MKMPGIHFWMKSAQQYNMRVKEIILKKTKRRKRFPRWEPLFKRSDLFGLQLGITVAVDQRINRLAFFAHRAAAIVIHCVVRKIFNRKC